MSVQPRPYPTPTRLRLLGHIAAGELVHYHFIRPETRNRVTDGLYTSRVAELVAAGLVDLGEPDDSLQSDVRLTEAGIEYLNTYGKNGADTP